MSGLDNLVPLLPQTERKYGVKDVVEGFEYEFRVSAVNISGAGEPSSPSEFVFARDPKRTFQAKLPQHGRPEADLTTAIIH